MDKVIINHKKYGMVLFDMNTQSYEFFDKKNITYFNFNNKQEIFFSDTNDFLKSRYNRAVIPFVCNRLGSKGKRTFCELIDVANNPFIFFNVEMINGRWTHNRITNFRKNKCYFTIVIKNKGALNDFMIISLIEINEAIKKRDVNTPL